MKNYYDELEVSKTASKETISKVYKILAKKYHPDTTKETDKKFAEEKFQLITEAYEVLSDPQKRREYNLKLEEEQKPSISYEDFMNIVNENNELKNLQNKVNQQQNQSFNNYQTPNNKNANFTTNSKSKKYYYNTVTGQNVSAFTYYIYRFKKFFSNIIFYVLFIIAIIAILSKLFFLR